MRRSKGVGDIRDKKDVEDKFREKRDLIQENLVDEGLRILRAALSKQMEQFRTKLDSFAIKYRSDIKKDPDFRRHFQEMCATIGVDPLASSKGFWSELLGMGSFYYEIAVQAVEIVLATAHVTGGVMKVGELKLRLNKSRSKSVKQSDISSDDIIRSIKSLDVLGNSCGLILDNRNLNDNYLVFCVPEELSLDNTTIIQYVSDSGFCCIEKDNLQAVLGWPMERITTALEQLVKESILWIDLYKNSCVYWFPSLFFDEKNLSKLNLDY